MVFRPKSQWGFGTSGCACRYSLTTWGAFFKFPLASQVASSSFHPSHSTKNWNPLPTLRWFNILRTSNSFNQSKIFGSFNIWTRLPSSRSIYFFKYKILITGCNFMVDSNLNLQAFVMTSITLNGSNHFGKNLVFPCRWQLTMLNQTRSPIW